ncbi:hypothetical protein EVAR_74532_1 [Eumeta japonica]|uniref:Uncharacterized protein n=1 Tax=Eumeta variegata TaxID=151549 RepID=A0A4C1TE99_EUMVA|nr:hypothetical protein EVAR_74532_1 [Eumeta japonica]
MTAWFEDGRGARRGIESIHFICKVQNIFSVTNGIRKGVRRNFGNEICPSPRAARPGGGGGGPSEYPYPFTVGRLL